MNDTEKLNDEKLDNSPMSWKFTADILLACLLLLFYIYITHDSGYSQIIVDNHSKQRLENVVLSTEKKDIKIGDLADRYAGGLLIVDRAFRRKLPEKLSVSFETDEGDSIKTKITFENEPTRNLTVTIDNEFAARGTFN